MPRPHTRRCSAPVFLARFGKSLWSPGQTVPFTVGWHASDGPVRIDYGVGSLPIPG